MPQEVATRGPTRLNSTRLDSNRLDSPRLESCNASCDVSCDVNGDVVVGVASLVAVDRKSRNNVSLCLTIFIFRTRDTFVSFVFFLLPQQLHKRAYLYLCICNSYSRIGGKLQLASHHFALPRLPCTSPPSPLSTHTFPPVATVVIVVLVLVRVLL